MYVHVLQINFAISTCQFSYLGKQYTNYIPTSHYIKLNYENNYKL